MKAGPTTNNRMTNKIIVEREKEGRGTIGGGGVVRLPVVEGRLLHVVEDSIGRELLCTKIDRVQHGPQQPEASWRIVPNMRNYYNDGL